MIILTWSQSLRLSLYFTILPLHYQSILRILHKQELSLLHYLFIYLLLVWTCEFLFSPMVYNSLLYLIIWHSSCPRFGQWELLKAGSCIFVTCIYHIGNTSLLSDIRRYSRLILCLSCLKAGISLLFCRALVMESHIREQYLGARYAFLLLKCLYLVVIQWTELGNNNLFIDTNKYT